MLWQIAVPLNNLLNRVQRWKGNSDLFERTVMAARYVHQEIQRARAQQVPVLFQRQTGTPLDPLLPEIQHLSEQVFIARRSRPVDKQ
jgi:hypothetical protein